MSSSQGSANADTDIQRYRALLETADLIVLHRNLPQLFRKLAKRLQQVTAFDVVNFVLHESGRNVMRLNIWEQVAPEQSPVPIQLSIEDESSGWVWEHQQPLIFPELEAETRFPEVMNALRARGVKSYCVLPMTTSLSRLGAIGFGSARSHAYEEADMQLLDRVAKLVAVAVENLLTQEALAHDRDRLQVLLELNNAMVSHLDSDQLFPVICACVRRVVAFDYADLALYDRRHHKIRLENVEAPKSKDDVAPQFSMTAEGSPHWQALQSRQPLLLNRSGIEGLAPGSIHPALQAGYSSLCLLPLVTSKGEIGTLDLASTREDAFDTKETAFLGQIADQVALAVDNAFAYRKIAELGEEKLYLEEEIRTEHGFEEIVGEGKALRHVLSEAETVAPSDATVLILGETGTGKERVARAIHDLSGRKQQTFIKLNCAAIPTGLLESELFGHEKGAFTGAIAQKVGRVELAHHGTLFLDEVGDIPLELQPKLLRVLQEQEFERLGGTRTIRVDVRLVAATNRDLKQMVEEGKFRSDLYYRLNVFPLCVPSLRERREDIPLLVAYFVRRFSQRMGKEIETIPAAAMNALMHWDWPGNVRELENIIERSVILTKGLALNVPLAELRTSSLNKEDVPDSLEAAERKHILRILRETKGVVSGPQGAAARLGLKRTTLQARMRKLGITRNDFSP